MSWKGTCERADVDDIAARMEREREREWESFIATIAVKFLGRSLSVEQ